MQTDAGESLYFQRIENLVQQGECRENKSAIMFVLSHFLKVSVDLSDTQST